MATLTKEQRADLATELNAIAAAAIPLRESIDPVMKALRGLDDMRNIVLMRYGITDDVMWCEGDHLIVPGDKYHACDDGPNLCEECAPTYADCLAQIKEAIEAADGSTDDDDLAEWRETEKKLESMTPEELVEKNVQEYEV